jgi:hypothetical protein
MSRVWSVVLAAVVLASVVAGTAMAAGQSDTPQRIDEPLTQQEPGAGSPAVTIADINVRPEEPIAGNTFEVEATIVNGEGASASFELRNVYVDKPDGRSYVASDVGTLAPGSSTTVSIPVTMGSEGQYTLPLEVSGIETDGGTVVTVSQPTSVRVIGEQRPRVNIIGSDWEAGSETTAELTVTNGGADPLQNIEVTLDGETITVDNPTRIRASLGAESKVTYGFDVTLEETGSQQLTAALRYTDPAGNDKTITEAQTVSVSERDPPLSLAVSADEVGPSETTAFEVTAVNERQTPITGLELQFESEDGQMVDSGVVIPALQSGNKTATELEVSEVSPGQHDLTVQASYTTARGEQESFTETLSTTVQAVSSPGRVSLSELQLTGRGTSVSIRGSVSNPGTSDVSGVRIEVGETEMVRPAQSQSSFFAGNITSSDFTNFQVNAQLRSQTNQTTMVPLRTSYVVDDVRQERVIEVEYDPQASPAGGGQDQARRQPQSESSGLPLGLAGIGLVVVGLAVLGWRRYRG